MRLASIAMLVLAGCGARSGLDVPPDAGPLPPEWPVREAPGCTPVDDGCGTAELCGNGSDDDCDGRADEGCACEPGAVQRCFRGPPGRRGVGACADGIQRCAADGTFGECTGGVAPTGARCTGRDDYCDGCGAEPACALDCPAPGDPRIPAAEPFQRYELRGRDFYRGPATSWSWRVEAGPCDALSPRLESMVLEDGHAESTAFTPHLSGDHRVTLRVRAPDGSTHECSWIVPVPGVGLRIELCYPESESEDLDLYLHAPDERGPWTETRDAFTPPNHVCGPANCGPYSRFRGPPTDWGYAPSPVRHCEGGPLGEHWRELGHCRNPRLDIDNNLLLASGLPENINIDRPRDGETFRVMVHNFSGGLARPLVHVYCGGEIAAAFGGPEDPVPGFQGRRVIPNVVGAMWRVADVTVAVDGDGRTTGCEVRAVHPPGRERGFDVTYEDPRF